MTKDERGNQGIDVWLKHKGIGTLNYTMQFGKTFIGIKVAQRAFIRNPDVRIIILTPSEIIYANWNRYLISYIDKDRLANVRILTRNQILERDDLECEILIVDEIHKFLTEAAFEALLRIKARYMLGLTGTPPMKGDEKVRLDKICPVIDTITSDEAVANGWITPFKEYNYVVQFNETDRQKYVELTEPISETLNLFKGAHREFNQFVKYQMFKSEYQLIDACYRGAPHPTIVHLRFPPSDIRNVLAAVKGWNMGLDITSSLNAQINEYWNPAMLELRAKAFDRQVRTRNSLMITHPLKLAKVNEIVLKFMKPTIIFNESTDFADAVCNSINRLGIASIPICTVYHSNIESKFVRDDTGDFIRYKSGARAGEPKAFGKVFLKADAIDGFTSGRYTCISTSKAMDEGLSIPNIEIVITTGGTTNPTQYQQRTARGKTVDIYNKDKKTLIVNVVFDNFYQDTTDALGNHISKLIHSRDLTKLIERQGEYSDAEWVTSIDEITL